MAFRVVGPVTHAMVSLAVSGVLAALLVPAALYGTRLGVRRQGPILLITGILGAGAIEFVRQPMPAATLGAISFTLIVSGGLMTTRDLRRYRARIWHMWPRGTPKL
jgi:hypothetical protein